MLQWLLTLGFVVCLFSLILSFVYIRKQQRKALDKGTNATTVTHPVAANPIYIVYVLFPVTALLGGILWMYYFR